MLAKKGMSKKKTVILVVVLTVMVIASLIIAYSTFWKKPEFTPMPMDGSFPEIIPDSMAEYPTGEFLGYPQAPIGDLEHNNTSQGSTASEFELELFEIQDFKNLKSYIDLPIEMDPEKIGNKDPFFVPVEIEEEDSEEN